MKKTDIHLLNDLQRREIRETAYNEVSNEHSFSASAGNFAPAFTKAAAENSARRSRSVF